MGTMNPTTYRRERGYLVDAQDAILLENCTWEDAQEWLRSRHNGKGWHGGRTTWLGYDSDHGVVFADSENDCEIVSH